MSSCLHLFPITNFFCFSRIDNHTHRLIISEIIPYPVKKHDHLVTHSKNVVLLQVLVLNHMHINGYATPFFFIYFILKYNSGVSRNVLMIWAFLLGLAVDIFGNTPGMNAAAATVLAFMREPILRLVTLRDSVEDFEPGIKSMGFSPFFRYILLCTFLFCTILLVIDTFSFFNLPVLLLKILTDASITVICILCAEAIRRKK